MNLMNAVNTGRIGKTALDASVARVLRLKFEMGLFENPYVDPEKAKKEVRSEESVTLARRVAQASITLLKNEHSLLPLNKNRKVALIGPNADVVLTAYYPGQEGGIAIADVLFGDFNPAGRLPFSVPRSVGQIATLL